MKRLILRARKLRLPVLARQPLDVLSLGLPNMYKEKSFECLNRLTVFNERFDGWEDVACCRHCFNDAIKESNNRFRMANLEFLGDEKIIKEVKAIVAMKD